MWAEPPRAAFARDCQRQPRWHRQHSEMQNKKRSEAGRCIAVLVDPDVLIAAT
jgi:hypothetical protein